MKLIDRLRSVTVYGAPEVKWHEVEARSKGRLRGLVLHQCGCPPASGRCCWLRCAHGCMHMAAFVLGALCQWHQVHDMLSRHDTGQRCRGQRGGQWLLPVLCSERNKLTSFQLKRRVASLCHCNAACSKGPIPRKRPLNAEGLQPSARGLLLYTEVHKYKRWGFIVPSTSCK